MIVFPNCKINLGLNILHKRADGFHDLETVFYPLMMKDVLEAVRLSTVDDGQLIVEGRESIVNSPQSTVYGAQSTINRQPSTINYQLQFTSSGLPIAGDTNSNLCVKAYHLLKQDFPSLPSIQMHLHKNIPMGAGLGGGSADGAFALRLLNDKFNLNLSQQQLIGYALQLGSDCPFFILNQPCFATSRGEAMHPINLDLSSYSFVIVNPGIHVNTGWAFSQITPTAPKKSVQDIIQQPIGTWKNELVNDFELPVSKQHPAINSIKQQLYADGALYASMSGSGSTVFGIFEKNTRPSLSFPNSYFTTSI